jgi:heme/copper-type cytochrome/quinol oxidase subunit 2
MAGGGVVIPMSLLGLANWLESKLDIRKPDSKKWQLFYNTMRVLSIVLFVAGAILGWYLLGNQISRLIPPP